MEEGDVVLIVFPQDEEKKLRPALVLREFPKYGDLLVCGITSRLNQFIPDFDIILDKSHPDFLMSRLKEPGVCRLNMLTMVSRIHVRGVLGKVSTKTHSYLLKNLADYLIKK